MYISSLSFKPSPSNLVCGCWRVWDGVSLCRPGWPWIHRNPPALVSPLWELNLKACTTAGLPFRECRPSRLGCHSCSVVDSCRQWWWHCCCLFVPVLTTSDSVWMVETFWTARNRKRSPSLCWSLFPLFVPLGHIAFLSYFCGVLTAFLSYFILFYFWDRIS